MFVLILLYDMLDLHFYHTYPMSKGESRSRNLLLSFFLLRVILPYNSLRSKGCKCQLFQADRHCLLRALQQHLAMNFSFYAQLIRHGFIVPHNETFTCILKRLTTKYNDFLCVYIPRKDLKSLQRKNFELNLHFYFMFNTLVERMWK